MFSLKCLINQQLFSCYHDCYIEITHVKLDLCKRHMSERALVPYFLSIIIITLPNSSQLSLFKLEFFFFLCVCR